MGRPRLLSLAAIGITAFGVLLAACSPTPAMQPEQPQQPAPAPESQSIQTQTGQSNPSQYRNYEYSSASPQQSTKTQSPMPAPAATTMQAAPTSPPAPGLSGQQSAPSQESRLYAGLSRSAMDSANQVGGTDNPNDEPYDANFFQHSGVNPFIDTEDDHFSTFAMDVDTASYSVARRFVTDGYLPSQDAVRVEEFVNYFDQGYEPPEDGAFAIHIDGSPSPYGTDTMSLMRVGIQGKTIAPEDRKPASLVFVIDVSGSMERENRLGLVKRSLRLLVDELRPTDDIGIVVYGERGEVLLNPSSGEEANREGIMEIIDSLHPTGSTNAEEGLLLGYEMAAKTVEPGRISRVILLSDGVANVGNTGSDSILNVVQDYVDQGVTLSTVGFGMGNFNDILMEQLANDGNGNYAYVDTLSEARRVFVENLTGTLQVIAKDSKIQVDFNPEVVRSYRLLGYENRAVRDEDFRNDEIDAGEVGADHSVTALYELKFHEGAEGKAATVFVRYEDPDTGDVSEVSRDFGTNDFAQDFEDTTPRFQLAAVVAEYAEILRHSIWAEESRLEDVLDRAEEVRQMLPDDENVAEFVELVSRASRIDEPERKD